LQNFALDQIRDAVYLVDKSGRIQYVNATACDMLGYSRNELLGMHVADVDHEWPAERWAEHWNSLKQTKKVLFPTHHRHRDGTLFPVEVSANYFAYNGKEYNLGIARDITERLKAEQKKSDEQMRLFFERQLVGMAITSPEKGWVKVNRKLEEMLGYSFAELKTMTWAEMTHPDDLAADVEQFDRMMKGEIEHYALEKRFIRKDGDIVFTHLSIGCVRKQDGTADYIIVLIEDISERKAAEAKLAETTSRLTSLIAAVPDMVWMKDKNGVYLAANNALGRFWGVAEQDIPGKTDYDFFPPTFANVCKLSDAEAIGCGGLSVVEETVTGADGQEQILETRKIPICREDGSLSGILGLARDITERKAQEETIKLLKHSLDFSLESLFIIDIEDFHFVQVNDRAAKTLGYSKEELTGGMGVMDIDPDCDMEILNEHRTMLQKAKAYTFESRHRSKSGRIYPVEIQSNYFEYNGKHYFLSLCLDITDRKRMETMLKGRAVPMLWFLRWIKSSIISPSTKSIRIFTARDGMRRLPSAGTILKSSRTPPFANSPRRRSGGYWRESLFPSSRKKGSSGTQTRPLSIGSTALLRFREMTEKWLA